MDNANWMTTLVLLWFAINDSNYFRNISIIRNQYALVSDLIQMEFLRCCCDVSHLCRDQTNFKTKHLQNTEHRLTHPNFSVQELDKMMLIHLVD